MTVLIFKCHGQSPVGTQTGATFGGGSVWDLLVQPRPEDIARSGGTTTGAARIHLEGNIITNCEGDQEEEEQEGEQEDLIN